MRLRGTFPAERQTVAAAAWCQEVSIFVMVAVPGGRQIPREVQDVDPFILFTCILPTAEAFMRENRYTWRSDRRGLGQTIVVPHEHRGTSLGGSFRIGNGLCLDHNDLSCAATITTFHQQPHHSGHHERSQLFAIPPRVCQIPGTFQRPTRTTHQHKPWRSLNRSPLTETNLIRSTSSSVSSNKC